MPCGHFDARDVGWTERSSESRPDQHAAPALTALAQDKESNRWQARPPLRKEPCRSRTHAA